MFADPVLETPNAKGPYRAHRERQRSRILAVAQKAFDERGIDRVSIGEIVSETGIRASTLYEYFSGKDEIVWALVEQLMKRSEAEAKKRIENLGECSALAKITCLLDMFREELAERPEQVRFWAQFDALYARNWTAERLLSLERALHPSGLASLSTLVEQGIADNSLRADLYPDLTLQAVLNAVIGTQRRLASLGKRLEQEYGRTVQELFDETVRLLLLGLQQPSQIFMKEQ